MTMEVGQGQQQQQWLQWLQVAIEQQSNRAI